MLHFESNLQLPTMPQVFQVLKCYKCSIFQVHQTKKDNKWKCKVCGEKQSVKRHYGIGTAKDCRIHVQKLNNLRGDIEESKLKAIDSEDSDYENNTENFNKINNTKAFSENAKEESKWSTYVDKEENSVVKEPEYIDNLEVCLELPQKRKINRKSKPFKVPKLSNECNKKTEIINEIIKKLPTLNSDELNTSNHTDNSTVLDYESSVKYQTKSSNEKQVVINKKQLIPTNGSSKWAQYIADDDTESDDQYGFKDDDENYMELYNEDLKAENCENNYHHEKSYQQHSIIDDIENRSKCKETEVHQKTVTSKLIFSLCDDNDLDNILEF